MGWPHFARWRSSSPRRASRRRVSRMEATSSFSRATIPPASTSSRWPRRLCSRAAVQPESSSQQAISREEGERIAQLQDDYIAGRDMIVVDGFIGDDPDFRTPARLYIEESNANVAGMQRQLYFEVEDRDSFEPELTVIY